MAVGVSGKPSMKRPANPAALFAIIGALLFSAMFSRVNIALFRVRNSCVQGERHC